MKTVLTSAAATLALLTAAFAADVAGTVSTVDPESRTIVLETGETFTLGEELVMDGIEPGTAVIITVDDSSGAVTAVTPAG